MKDEFGRVKVRVGRGLRFAMDVRNAGYIWPLGLRVVEGSMY